MKNFKEELSIVPHSPGSYQMYNKNNIIIYVGKAKDLQKRLKSYFTGRVTGKTKKMVSEVDHFKYIVASSEVEAFILEINLIKEYEPKYNIMLRDDKSYPYIEYIKHPYPSLKVSRYLTIKKKDNKKLFGPYPNAYAARRIVNLINRIYPLKKCRTMPKKVCLYYHIGECLGYCENKIDSIKLEEMEKEILSFLSGNSTFIKKRIVDKINTFSENLNYEMAISLKEELDYIKVIDDKQKVEMHDLTNRDIIGYYYNNSYLSIEVFFIRNGKLVGRSDDLFAIIEEPKESLENYISKFYNKREIPKEIITSGIDNEMMSTVLNTKVYTPIKGDKKRMLDMAINNANINYDNHIALLLNDEKRTEKANDDLAELLNIDYINRIDLFDNSNLFGSYSVSGMVVFKNGRPAKNEYRKYKISLEKNDDYNTMREVFYRRYYRALVEKSELPDLIIVDGGEKQMHAAREILNSLNINIKLCGLKKNDKHETNVLINDLEEEIPIDPTSDLFHYLTRMQDEVHRYTITYHKTLRSKGSIASILDNIEGIGDTRRKKLLKKYGSITKMKEASVQELSELIPESIAINLKKYLENF